VEKCKLGGQGSTSTFFSTTDQLQAKFTNFICIFPPFLLITVTRVSRNGRKDRWSQKMTREGIVPKKTGHRTCDTHMSKSCAVFPNTAFPELSKFMAPFGEYWRTRKPMDDNLCLQLTKTFDFFLILPQISEINSNCIARNSSGRESIT
jgi:hypothetical protein